MTTRSHNYAKLRFFPENQASPPRKTSVPECAGPVRRDGFPCDSLLFGSLRRRCSPVPIRRKTEVSGKMSSLGGVVRQDERAACAMRDGRKRRRNCGMTEGKGKADCGTRCEHDERRGSRNRARGSALAAVFGENMRSFRLPVSLLPGADRMPSTGVEETDAVGSASARIFPVGDRSDGTANAAFPIFGPERMRKDHPGDASGIRIMGERKKHPIFGTGPPYAPEWPVFYRHSSIRSDGR